MKKPHEMPSLPSNIAFGLGAAVLAACGTAVTVNPGFSPQAAGKIDRMLLVIDNQGGLRGLVGGERPVEAIAGEVQEGLSDAGYPIRTPAELGLSGTEITALTAGRAAGSAKPDYSHVLEVTVAPVQHGKAPSGFSLTLGDSDPRGQGSRRGEVLPIRCALLDGRSLREEAIARSDRAVPKGEEGWRSKASGPDQRIAALAAEIRATCEPLLGELNVARTGGEPAAATTYGSGIRIEVVPAEEVAKEKAAVSTAPAPAPAPEPASPIDTAAPGPAPSPVRQVQERAAAPPAPGQPGAVSEPVAAEPPSVSTEHTTTKTGRKQIRVYNPGGTVILEFGHDRR
ncbi:MAG: hypothetical protein M3495_07095 [Pseudomonadota bacterium]|nr:hypothetical protein [Pseudomonadota bacterium]